MNLPLDGRVAVVTGGGGGIGSASAMELSRQGATVVAMDPGVGVQGEDLGEPTAAATAEQVRSAGGTAAASSVSVTDAAALNEFFQQVRRQFGSLDIVVNTAGIVRYPALPDADEDDWAAVLDVHFDGYLNVLVAALPIMIEAGYGRIVGFTSGVGLARTIGANVAYGCAKRAVAALTWDLGPQLPPGVNLNAMSPIAATRMVRRALAAEGADPRGLDLSAMPQPEHMAPATAYLAGDRVGFMRGQVLFSAGSEVSLLAPPRLIEAVRSEGVEDFGTVLGTLVPVILGPAEEQQRTGGGSNPRVGDVFRAAPGPGGTSSDGSVCLVISDQRPLATAVMTAVGGWGMKALEIDHRPGFDEVERTLTEIVSSHGRVDAIVVITAEEPVRTSADADWRGAIDGYRTVGPRVMQHAAWTRAAARLSDRSRQPMRLIHLCGALTTAGRTTTQAVTQLARSAMSPPVTAPLDEFSVSIETDDAGQHRAIGQLVGRLACTEDGRTLRGAELVAATGWAGLRSHPGPAVTVTFGGTIIPAGVDSILRSALSSGATGPLA